MELVLVHSNKINKKTIKVFNTPYIKVLQVNAQRVYSMGILQTKWIIKAIRNFNST
jgi:hypothetical protein